MASDHGSVLLLSLLDLSAAFDTFDLNILSQRLFCTFGLSGRVLEWLRLCLAESTQAVVVNNRTTDQSHLNLVFLRDLFSDQYCSQCTLNQSVM